jgi:hypothetical protein
MGAALGVQILGLLALRHLYDSDFGPGRIPPPDVVTRAHWWCALFGLTGVFTSAGATYWLLRRAHAVTAIIGIVLLALPACFISLWACVVWFAGMGWW